jgi:hypothetical protein
MPGARRTRSLVCAWGSEYAHEYSQRVRRDRPASPRNGFTAYAVLSLAIGLSCHHRLRKLPSANLTPASRRQDHTSSPSASVPFVIGTSSVHRIPPRVRDDREPPLKWDGTAAINEVIWVERKAKIFLLRGWTHHPNQGERSRMQTNTRRRIIQRSGARRESKPLAARHRLECLA